MVLLVLALEREVVVFFSPLFLPWRPCLQSSSPSSPFLCLFPFCAALGGRSRSTLGPSTDKSEGDIQPAPA